MLGVGVDWAEEFHLVALGRPGVGVFDIARIEHDPGAVAALVARIGKLEPDPAEVRVVIETRHGLLVEALVDAGYTVLPVNPDLIARRRGPARKKDDAEDARIACLLALDRFTELRVLVPHGELAGELRAIARDDLRAQRDERRLLNRLRADLAAVFPAGLVFAGDDLGSPVVLKLLQRWPSAEAMTQAGKADLEALARQAKHGWPDRFADRVIAALGEDHFVARDYLVRAKADTIRLACAQLLLLREQRRAWQRRMGELLLGDRRRGRAKQPGDQRGPAVPGGEIYLSFPGLGDRLAARIAGEIGDAIGQFDTPNALQCYAGKAPVTRRSGKSELVVACRLACNRYLADAVQQWAFTSLRNSGWAREFYDTQRGRGKRHQAALRALGNRWRRPAARTRTNDVDTDEHRRTIPGGGKTPATEVDRGCLIARPLPGAGLIRIGSAVMGLLPCCRDAARTTSCTRRPTSERSTGSTQSEHIWGCAQQLVHIIESDLIRMRPRKGMKVAKAKGGLRGKAPKLSAAQETHLGGLYRTAHHR